MSNLPMEDLERNVLAMMQVTEGAKTLKQYSGSWRETLLLNIAVSLYEHRLENARRILPPEYWTRIEERFGK